MGEGCANYRRPAQPSPCNWLDNFSRQGFTGSDVVRWFTFGHKVLLVSDDNLFLD